MKQAPKVQGWIGYLAYHISRIYFSSELDFVFLRSYLHKSGRKGERESRKYGDQQGGKFMGGKKKEWVMIKLNRANTKYEHHRWQPLE